MYWRVVEFLEEGSVEAVPLAWIVSPSECCWPPYSDQKLKKAISGSEAPGNMWKRYKIRIIGEIYGCISLGNSIYFLIINNCR